MFDKFKLVCIGATGIIFIASYFFVGVHYYRNGYETATKKYDEVLRSESEKNYQKIKSLYLFCKYILRIHIHPVGGYSNPL